MVALVALAVIGVRCRKRGWQEDTEQLAPMHIRIREFFERWPGSTVLGIRIFVFVFALPRYRRL